ncbi:MAG TPA: carboxypeptidase-like regulatory domain-containing protein, partial [Flavisolibacter sp.]|nr:carboxypeptidase-like regulatory domain-containing protein [Flavisolibacter sp.]
MRKILCLFGGVLFFALTCMAQTREIKGRVQNDAGLPLPNVSVQERGSRQGTVTDENGNFRLSVKDGATLILSSIGYDSKEVKPGASSELSISLFQSNQSLSEVVVTGVGVATSKKKVAFAVEAVNINNQVKVSTGDVGQQLVGQIAGAQISSTNGSPGAPLNILLRGINSLNRSTSPMILMDGLQVGVTNLTSLDLSTIDRVEVVQGAAAATIYGAQGANGVIQLFTKKAKAGKINVDVSSSFTSNELLNVGNVSKAKYHAFVTNSSNEVISSGGSPLVWDPVLGSYSANVQYSALSTSSFANKAYDKNLQFYDHYKMFFQKGQSTNHSIAVSGNKDKVDFLLSASNNQQNSNFKRNGDYERSNLTSNLGIELLKGLRL